jgi:hypothetical protein
MRKVVIQALSPDGDHPAAGLVIVTEIMLFWLAFDHFAEEPAQMLIARALPHRRLDIEFEMAAETGPQFSFTSQPQFVATFAEMQVGHSSNEPDSLQRISEPVV